MAGIRLSGTSITAAALAGNLVLFVALYPYLGPAACILGTLPVVAAGWWFGLWAGVAAGILALPLHILLFEAAGMDGLGMMAGPGLAVSAMLLLIGAAVGRLSDVSRRLRLELARHIQMDADLQASERRYRSLSQLVSNYAFYIRIEPDGRLAYEWVNDYFHTFTGYTLEDINANSYILVHPDDQAQAQAQVEQVRQGQPSSGECRIITRSGETRWARIHRHPVWDAQHSRVVGYYGITQDITERKQAEDERRAQLWFLESMDRVNQTIQATSDIEQMMSGVLDSLLDIFGCDRAWLAYPCDPASPTWEVPMERTRAEYPSLIPAGTRLQQEPVGAAVARLLRETPGPVQFHPDSAHPIPIEIAEGLNVRSFIATAFYPKVDKPWAFGLDQCSHARVWTAREERLFQEIGRRLADALSTLLLLRGLRESELRYREIFENSSDLIQVCAITPEGRFQFLDFNPAWEQVTGIKRERLIGTFLDELPDRSATTLMIRERHEEMLRTGRPVNFEAELLTETGHWHTHNTLVPVSGPNGDIYRLVAVGRNITAQKQAEDELRRLNAELEERVRERAAELHYERALLKTILDSMGEGVIYIEDSRTRYANQAIADMVGTDTAGVIDQINAIIANDQLRAAYTAQIFQNQPVTEGIWRATSTLARSDGSPFDAALTVTMMRTGTAQQGAIILVRDITAEKQLEAQKARFIANASHELRTPITNLKTRLYLLARRPEQLQTHLAVLERVADRMGNLVEDLLDISRFERGVLSLAREPAGLQALIEDAVESQQPEAARKNITLDCALPAEPLPVLLDSRRMTQVLLNLITNAINYTPENGHISVELSREGDQAVVRVRDTGVGIAPQHLERVFEPFFRTEASSGVRGTGLGLCISREIVELHDGRIEVESVPGQGSTFSVRLPLALANTGA